MGAAAAGSIWSAVAIGATGTGAAVACAPGRVAARAAGAGTGAWRTERDRAAIERHNSDRFSRFSL